MPYVELSRSQDILVTTTVEFDFDGQKLLVEIVHFNPRTENDIILGIENREASERRAYDERIVSGV